jgi:hypothetical protein
MNKAEAQLRSKNEVLDLAKKVKTGEQTVWITAGAGDIDELVNPLTHILENK